MTINQLLTAVQQQEIQFKDILDYIEERYIYSPSGFRNGDQSNLENQNQGSAKVLFFAQLHDLSESDTLSLFAEHYQSVLANPSGTDHQNIRQFMAQGWSAVQFDRIVLEPK